VPGYQKTEQAFGRVSEALGTEAADFAVVDNHCELIAIYVNQ